MNEQGRGVVNGGRKTRFEEQSPSRIADRIERSVQYYTFESLERVGVVI